ncbi:fructosamine kinase family protein [Fulvivirgaceae bacterium PWU4]|uniref:Fructosamine kinase family protein n=1 Tax=Chryseosolibacter histidini TaxID=2782349 RepID=A0AAP2GSG0_9BACT|nr:fructosamine kinase family protein [Chryseosolibacter histidini]MBT1701110.1 fructosamine kinase family protein [Chryseosolibacter histidini]
MLSSVPSVILKQLEESVSSNPTDFSFCGGGCINHGGRLKTRTGDLFLKWNDAAKFPGMFIAEAKGLKLLRNAGDIYIPEVITEGVAGSLQFLVLEFVEEHPQAGTYWTDLGQQLANLHKHTAPTYGLDHANYIGSLPQQNTRTEKWTDFFITQRLEAQVKLALDRGKINVDTVMLFSILYNKLGDLLPEEKPCLLHGDLWSGNLITNDKGRPCLIDPAVYYGHREAEIAFTTLFGGFSDEFYNSYHEAFALAPGYAERFDIYNLYPLMVHVNLFGGGYVSQVVSILRQWV